MQRTAGHQRDVRPVLGVEDEGVLHIRFVTVGLNSYLIEVVDVGGGVVVLSAVALLVKQSDAAVEDIDGT